MEVPRSLYWLKQPAVALRADEVNQALTRARHRPLTPHMEYGAGFVAPVSDSSAMLHAAGDWLFGLLRVDTRKIPPQQLEAEVQRRLRQNAPLSGSERPAKEHLQSIRDEAVRALLPDCFPSSRLVFFALHRFDGVLCIDSAVQRDRSALLIKLGVAHTALRHYAPWETDLGEWFIAILEDTDRIFDDLQIGSRIKVRHKDDNKADIRFNDVSPSIDAVQNALQDGFEPYEIMMHASTFSFHLMRTGNFSKIKRSTQQEDELMDYDKVADFLDSAYTLRKKLDLVTNEITITTGCTTFTQDARH